MKPTFVAFDTETTGLEPESCELCEVAGVKFQLEDSGMPREISYYSSLVAIEGSMPAHVSKINNIYDRMLINAPSPRAAIGGFFKWVGPSAIMMAHHAAFDVSFLGAAVHKHGLMLPKNPVFCTKRMSCRMFPELRHRLVDLENELVVGPLREAKMPYSGEKHRALYDSQVLMFVMAAMLQRIPKDKIALPGLLKYLPTVAGESRKFDDILDSHQLEQMYAELK